MHYKKKPNSLNILIEVAIKLNNKFYKLDIETHYNKANSKAKLYFRYASYYN